MAPGFRDVCSITNLKVHFPLTETCTEEFCFRGGGMNFGDLAPAPYAKAVVPRLNSDEAWVQWGTQYHLC
jgi:hypothetical protein